MELGLPLPRGDRDLPMMITDGTFDADNQLTYQFSSRGVRGDQSLINGVPQPRASVAPLPRTGGPGAAAPESGYCRNGSAITMPKSSTRPRRESFSLLTRCPSPR